MYKRVLCAIMSFPLRKMTSAFSLITSPPAAKIGVLKLTPSLSG